MFNVGDLVVCVDDQMSGGVREATHPDFIRAGRHYRISRVGKRKGEWGVQLLGDPNMIAWPNCGWKADRFRKIDAPDTEVLRLIRACKHVREGQPA